MKKRIALATSGLSLLAFSAAMLLITASPERAMAQQKKERASPHEEKSWVIGGKKITIAYGRPYKKGREIFGGLEPWGKVWRTGADEATTFTTEADLMMGPLHLIAGTYSLFTIPNQNEWTLIFNTVSKQWGAFKYDQAKDYGRTAMKVSKSPSVVEQLTIDIAKKDDHNGILKISWDQTVASVEFMVH